MDLRDIRKAEDLRGKKVLLRSDLNVPIKEGKIINDFRLRNSLKTINFLKEAGAKVILTGHRGREKKSLSVVYEYLKEYIPMVFTGEVLGEKTSSVVESVEDGNIVLLENLRIDDRETINDEDFTKELAGLADIYVNDAFSVSHREHTSIVGVPKYLPSFTGILFQKEIEELSQALNPPPKALCILGGAKFATKEPLIEKLINIYDKVFVSGALAHDFFKTKGFNIGMSLSSDFNIKELAENKKIIIPPDITVKNDEGVFVKKPNKVLDGDYIVDAGPKTITELKKLISEAEFVLWNGPMGLYEKGFGKYTEELAKLVAEADAKTIIGGGDTVSAIEHLGLEDKFDFISTGGGAMLKFLLDGTLVGIEALKLAHSS